jgi:hypothetical protein
MNGPLFKAFRCSDKWKGKTRNAIRFSDVDPP